VSTRKLRMPARCDLCGYSGRTANGAYCTCRKGENQRWFDAKAREEMLAIVHENRRRALTRKLTLPEGYRGYTLDTHPLRTSNDSLSRASWMQVRDWLAMWDWRRGLILRGPFGVGKTALVVGIMQSLVEQAITDDWSMRFMTSLELTTKLKSGFNAERGSEDAYDAVLRDLTTVHLLALDDLGAEEYQGGFDANQLLPSSTRAITPICRCSRRRTSTTASLSAISRRACTGA
jgi:DNA replication protein DnaC